MHHHSPPRGGPVVGGKDCGTGRSLWTVFPGLVIRNTWYFRWLFDVRASVVHAKTDSVVHARNQLRCARGCWCPYDGDDGDDDDDDDGVGHMMMMMLMMVMMMMMVMVMVMVLMMRMCTGTWTLLPHPTPPVAHDAMSSACVCWTARKMIRLLCLCVHRNTPPVTDHEWAVPVSAGQQERW